MGNIELVFRRSLVALAIRLKHTPAGYTEVSLQYFRFVFMHLIRDNLKEAEKCLMTAIITARLSTVLLQTFIQQLEEVLAYLREKINEHSRQKPIVHHLTSIPGANLDHFIRRTTSEMLSIYAELRTLQIDKAEYERLPDKRIESQIND